MYKISVILAEVVLTKIILSLQKTEMQHIKFLPLNVHSHHEGHYSGGVLKAL